MSVLVRLVGGLSLLENEYVALAVVKRFAQWGVCEGMQIRIGWKRNINLVCRMCDAGCHNPDWGELSCVWVISTTAAKIAINNPIWPLQTRKLALNDSHCQLISGQIRLSNPPPGEIKRSPNAGP